jgi:uncharacterized RDD family membrane protein YckC
MILDGLLPGIPLGILNSVLLAVFGHDHLREVGGRLVTVKTDGGVGVLFFLVVLVVQGLYFACLNGQGTGQTVGNRAPGIAVRDVDTGEAIGLKRGFVRWLVRFALYIALIIPGIVNDLFPLWDAKRQTIADKAARSVVIRLK